MNMLQRLHLNFQNRIRRLEVQRTGRRRRRHTNRRRSSQAYIIVIRRWRQLVRYIMLVAIVTMFMTGTVLNTWIILELLEQKEAKQMRPVIGTRIAPNVYQ